MDDLAHLTDEALRHIRRPPHIIVGWEFRDDRYEEFKYGRYDHSQFDPARCGYQLIRLGGRKGYFVIVDRRDYRRLSKHKWKPRVIYEKDEDGEKTGRVLRVDACRTVRKHGKDTTVYMHREITGAGAGLDVDHKNGLALDNRRRNLRCRTRAENNHNWVSRVRPLHPDLPRGVEWADRAKQKVRGIIWWTVSGKRKCARSRPLPFSAENAQTCHRWYLKARNKLYGHKKWAVGGGSCDLPTFPPILKQTGSQDSGVEIPF